MPSEPFWLSRDDLIDLNRLIVEGTGEPFAVIKPNELESACARPRNLWAYGEKRLAHLATALITGVSRNHPFAQGNKRTAFASALIFFQNNGWYLDMPDGDAFGLMVEELILGRLSEEEFANEIDQYLVDMLHF